MPDQLKRTAAICTMGCKVNTYESARMAEELTAAGWIMVDFREKADVYIINTCTVTQIAARKSRQMIHRARALSPDALVIAAGCYVDRDDSLIKEGVIDLAISNQDKPNLVELINKTLDERAQEQQSIEEYTELSESASSQDLSQATEPVAPSDHTRAFIKIQDGCRQFCSYCIIPYVRGPLKSRPIGEIVEEVKGLTEKGYKEVVLTGIHVSSYGLDWKEQNYNRMAEEGIYVGEDLARLILELDRITGLARIRLSSLEPRLITKEFVSEISKSKKLCPHFHLSLQSGCDRTLKEMNRHYTADDFREAVRLLRAAFDDPFLSTDVIAGFPGETEEDHQASLDFVREMKFAEAHIFPYSRMDGTTAGKRKDQIPADVKKRRAHDLLHVTGEASKAYMERMQGKEVTILLEQIVTSGQPYFTGLTDNYVRIAIPADRIPEGTGQGDLLKVRIDGYVNIRSANHNASGLDTILRGI
ncbi:MAG: tRNA (N(6)-L-threonylcarbamoyladenosine(37)-C(2))-methylthiotransferase MtaB [Firmicutes bacterium]|nr:tRNA (N(6)-L-threonylcarbamoyladenosine(37)-C(2))-methylthiotransferase MtaB [Bacillota bacterium]